MRAMCGSAAHWILLRKQGGQAAGTGSYEIAYATRIICFAKQGGLYGKRN